MDAHTLYITAIRYAKTDVLPRRLRKDAVVLRSLDELGLRKFEFPMPEEVVRALRSKGECQYYWGEGLYYHYLLRKTRHADMLKIKV